ncbi:hypothetical protein NDN08_004884 [Rhodosorus marinus]|uniref:Uncharacterized protein n=1 Tax=Rhodosorus marinus TaxID=101924 RepID=A0AAV8UI93_9RHOD|nr:hypothetical protein NDN08_004884 [Rhodosorus marinus]
MHRLAAFMLLSMVVSKLTAGATCDADPKKGLFGYEEACFDLLDIDGVKHGAVCTSTLVTTSGMCLRAEFTLQNTDSSLLKLRGGLHKMGDPVTKGSSRYTRKLNIDIAESPYLQSASLYFCPSDISVLELPCCGSDLNFLGFARIAVPGPDPDSERVEVKAYVNPQPTTAKGICNGRTTFGGRVEFLCALKLTCDSCPSSACNNNGICVEASNYACGGDLTVGGMNSTDGSCQCEDVTCEDNECFDPIQGCHSIESSPFCDALAGSVVYADGDGNCSCCPTGSCAVGSGDIECIAVSDFATTCMFASAITDSQGRCHCCSEHPDHCFDSDKQRCVGALERKETCDARAAVDPDGRQTPDFARAAQMLGPMGILASQLLNIASSAKILRTPTATDFLQM